MFTAWDGVPAGSVSRSHELGDYLSRHAVETRNGHLEGSGLLVNVSGAVHGGQARLLEPAAQAWEAMRSAAARDGVDLRVIDTYRSYETQAHAHEAYLAGKKPANVLPPGKSEHGNGLAIDVSNGRLVGPGDREWDWLNAHGESFGWHPISNESWHWEFRGTP
ncbi:MAG: D-alanyl-D-alanine carboxypeptidase family protein [Acidimicrobiia bacterium]